MICILTFQVSTYIDLTTSQLMYFLFFSQGSVVVNYTLVFTDDMAPITTDDVSDVMKQAATDGSFGNFTVDPNSIVHEGT